MKAITMVLVSPVIPGEHIYADMTFANMGELQNLIDAIKAMRDY